MCRIEMISLSAREMQRQHGERIGTAEGRCGFSRGGVRRTSYVQIVQSTHGICPVDSLQSSADVPSVYVREVRHFI